MATSTTSWHSSSLDNVLQVLGTDADKGLHEVEAQKRLDQYGANALREQPRPTFWQRLLAQFQSFVIYILIFAAILSAALGDWAEAAAIAAIVALNAILGVVQEGRAEEALAALRKLSAPDAVVIRNGIQQTIPGSHVVPGDIVVLDAGNYVPADVRLVEAINLKVDEASLTGESVPVDKRDEADVTSDAIIGDRKNMAYMSTTITYGRGRAVVVSTGMQTEIGKIADMIQSTEEEATPLQQRLDQLGRVLSIGALIICLLVGVVIFGREMFSDDGEFLQALEDSLLTAVALAIAAVPEGLPAIVTINLAIGMREMIRRNALIRRLPAVETLGSASAICSDKTGTLTQNEMTTVKLHAAGITLDVTGHGYIPEGQFFKNGETADPDQFPAMHQLLLGGLLASDARLENPEGTQNGHRMIGDPTEGALVVAAAKANLWRGEVEARYPRVNEIPFDSTRKRMSTIHQNPDGQGYIAFIKGAPEIVLEFCDNVLVDGAETPLTPEGKVELKRTNSDMADDALRVLAVAQRHFDTLPDDISPDTIETGLTLVGLSAMIDPAR
ncbi:MAG: HAD-IC family P-type ATPase, partial [Chloroflexi bacterium]|nr:HAD-IC family P-type ATPase [Chloroflexota bacterium]